MEAQSAELDVRMAAACDFKGAESASAAFLKACVQQCFLDARPLAAALEGIYALCRRVCILVRVRGQQRAAAAPSVLKTCSWAPSASFLVALTTIVWQLTACSEFEAVQSCTLVGLQLPLYAPSHVVLYVCASQRDAEAAQARERLPGLGSETALLTADFRARAAGLYVLLQNSELLVRRARPPGRAKGAAVLTCCMPHPVPMATCRRFARQHMKGSLRVGSIERVLWAAFLLYRVRLTQRWVPCMRRVASTRRAYGSCCCASTSMAMRSAKPLPALGPATPSMVQRMAGWPQSPAADACWKWILTVLLPDRYLHVIVDSLTHDVFYLTSLLCQNAECCPVQPLDIADTRVLPS